MSHGLTIKNFGMQWMKWCPILSVFFVKVQLHRHRFVISVMQEKTHTLAWAIQPSGGYENTVTTLQMRTAEMQELLLAYHKFVHVIITDHICCNNVNTIMKYAHMSTTFECTFPAEATWLHSTHVASIVPKRGVCTCYHALNMTAMLWLAFCKSYSL